MSDLITLITYLPVIYITLAVGVVISTVMFYLSVLQAGACINDSVKKHELIFPLSRSRNGKYNQAIKVNFKPWISFVFSIACVLTLLTSINTTYPHPMYAAGEVGVLLLFSIIIICYLITGSMRFNRVAEINSFFLGGKLKLFNRGWSKALLTDKDTRAQLLSRWD